MGRWLGGIEQWVTGPNIAEVIQAQVWMLEEVASLSVDLEWPPIIEPINIEPIHATIVLRTLTNDYNSVRGGIPNWDNPDLAWIEGCE